MCVFLNKNLAWCSCKAERTEGETIKFTQPFFFLFCHERRLCWSTCGSLPSTHHCSSPWLSASLPLPRPPSQLPQSHQFSSYIHPWGTLLASTPTHGMPWRRNRAHRRHRANTAQPTDQVVKRTQLTQADPSLPATWTSNQSESRWPSTSSSTSIPHEFVLVTLGLGHLTESSGAPWHPGAKGPHVQCKTCQLCLKISISEL